VRALLAGADPAAAPLAEQAHEAAAAGDHAGAAGLTARFLTIGPWPAVAGPLGVVEPAALLAATDHLLDG
jgi:hypothetical protein